MSPTPEDSPARFSHRLEILSLIFFLTHGGLPLPLCPRPQRLLPRWRPRRPLRPLVRLPCRFPLIPLPLLSASFCPPLPPPGISASSSDTNSSVSSLLHSALSAAISSVSVPTMPYSPPASLSWFTPVGSSVFLPLLLSANTVDSVSSISPLAAPDLPLFSPLLSLGLPPAPISAPLLYIGLLRPPAPPRAPPPPAPAADISRKAEYVGDQTGGGETRWPTAGRSMPCRKVPSRPLAVVGDGIRWPLFLHRT